MIPVLLFFGLCFFGFGDCENDDQILELERFYDYMAISKERCFNYYGGMWSERENGLSICITKIPHGMIQCIDTTKVKLVNFGIDYCDLVDVDVEPYQLICKRDIFAQRYCLLKDEAQHFPTKVIEN